MAEKTLNTRIINKNDIKENWDKATNFVPKKGEVILYNDLRKTKIGDGETTVVNLPYANETGSVHLVEGPATDKTAGTWTGSIDCLTEYYDGLTLIYIPKVAGASTTTLNINSLGAKKCIRQASSNLTTHYGTGTAIMFVYRSSLDSNNGGWQTLAIYDTTDVSMLRSNYARYYVGDYPLYKYKLCAIDSKERLQPLSLENTTAATKTQTSIAFKPDMLYYFSLDATIAANTIVTAQAVYYSYYMTTGTYTFNATVPTYHTIYLVGSLDSDTGLFTLDQTDKTSWYKFVPYNNTFTKNEDYFVEGKYYIYVGRSYSTNNYYSLEVCNPLYYFDGHNLVLTNTGAERAKILPDDVALKEIDSFTPGKIVAVDAANKLYTIDVNDTDVAKKSELKTVATSGSYNDLTDKPTIPSVTGKEDTANKVSAWSSTVNNTHYPTEKLVKDSLDTKQDKITSTNKLAYSLLSGTPTIPRKLADISDRSMDHMSELRYSVTPSLTWESLINKTRANRLMFLPADQIIIEKSVDAGATWTDANVADSIKVALFYENDGTNVRLPQIDGHLNTNCMLRITISAMKYNVPAGTAETAKYNYWNSEHVASRERYVSLSRLYFYVNANGGSRLWCRVERAAGSASNNWSTVFDTSTNAAYKAFSGNSGPNFVTIPYGVFGGAISQTANFWNYRFTFRTATSTETADGIFDNSKLSASGTTNAILGIRGYGYNGWTFSNNMSRNDHLYSFDGSQNATFPAQVKAASLAVTGGTASGFLKANGTVDTNTYVKSSALKTVATTGSYNDLTNKPTIPTDTNQTIKVGSTTFGTNDAVELVAGDNVTLTPDTTNKTITISTESSSGDTYLYSYLNVDQNKPCYNTGTTWHWGYYVSGAEIPFTPDTFKPIMLKKIKYNNVVYTDGTCRGVAIESKTNHNKAVRFDILINSVWRTVALAIFTNNPNPSTSHTRYQYRVLMSYDTEWDLMDCNEVGIVLIDISLDGDIQLSGNTEIYLEMPEEPVVDVITFSISGVNYSAANGMTWGEWLISKYNTSSIAFSWPKTTIAAITATGGDYLYNTNYEEQTLTTQIENNEGYLIE